MLDRCRMKKDVKRKDVRVSRDPVTGKLESVVLDAVQLAFERCTQVIEGKMMALSNGDVHRLAAKLADWLARMQPHRDSDLLEDKLPAEAK
jgi:hypothetical protein